MRDADFTHDVYSLFPGSGLTLAQLYSTASYQAHDLTGIGLFGNDLPGANFANQNLNYARLGGALNNANFSQANLTNAVVGGTLTGANFTNAEVRGAAFSGITKGQLYSTASYQAKDLTGISLFGNDLPALTSLVKTSRMRGSATQR